MATSAGVIFALMPLAAFDRWRRLGYYLFPYALCFACFDNRCDFDADRRFRYDLVQSQLRSVLLYFRSASPRSSFCGIAPISSRLIHGTEPRFNRK